MTLKCWHHSDNALGHDDVPQTLVTLTHNDSIQDTEWTTDVGASAHMIGNSSMLKNLHRFLGNYVILIGDGTL